MKALLKPSLNWLLVFVPLAAALHYFTDGLDVWVFAAACVAVIPLAGFLEAVDRVAKGP